MGRRTQGESPRPCPFFASRFAPLPAPPHNQSCQPPSTVDSLYWYDRGLVGVEYGTGTYRVVHWKLSPDGLEVKSSETVERGTEMVRSPTTGAILADKFYFMVDTGIENLDNGKISDPRKLEPLQIAILPLR